MHDHFYYMGALFGVIGIGWLVVVPMYRGWKHLNREMRERVRKSSRMLAEHSRADQGLPRRRTGW